MSTAEQWATALSGGTEGFTLRFDRLGLEAACRTLGAEEVEECRRMGGERGMRYALYLACDQLRQAGEQLRQRGDLPTAFSITERLGYGDAVAAGAAILDRSGANQARVTLSREGTEQPLTLPGELLLEGSGPVRAGSPVLSWDSDPLWEGDGTGRLVRDLADRLQAAAGNQ